MSFHTAHMPNMGYTALLVRTLDTSMHHNNNYVASDWSPVLSGVPHRVPLLALCYS